MTFLQRLLAAHRPTHLAWVHDSGLSFRHEVFPEYKATREKLTEELQDDFDRGVTRIEQLLEAYRVPVVSVPGYEADDVIGTLAHQAVAQGIPVVIVSGDKDFHQLVRPGVWLLNPGRGGPAGVEEHWVGMPNADERLGVPPQHVTDYLALVGDASDNDPGVPGTGDKTARELVREFGGLVLVDNRPSFDINIVLKDARPLQKTINRLSDHLHVPSEGLLAKLHTSQGHFGL